MSAFQDYTDVSGAVRLRARGGSLPGIVQTITAAEIIPRWSIPDAVAAIPMPLIPAGAVVTGTCEGANSTLDAGQVTGLAAYLPNAATTDVYNLGVGMGATNGTFQDAGGGFVFVSTIAGTDYQLVGAGAAVYALFGALPSSGKTTVYVFFTVPLVTP